MYTYNSFSCTEFLFCLYCYCKYNYQKEVSIGFFLGINPKLTLRKVLKQRIDETCILLDLDDEDTKKLIKEISSDNKTTQKLVIIALISTTDNLDQEHATKE